MAAPSSKMEQERANIMPTLPLLVATVEPANERTLKAFDELADCKESLHISQQENFHVELSSTPKQSFVYPDDVGPYEPDTPLYHPRYKAHLNLAFRMKEDGTIPLKFTFGRGDGDSSTAGVTHLLIAPGKDPRGVIAKHMTIEFDLESGVPVIVAHDDEFPVYFWLNDEKKILRKGERSVPLNKVNHFGIGLLEFRLIYQVRDPVSRQHFLRVREYAFSMMNREVPDRRIKALPQNRPFNYANNTIVHDVIGKGSWGEVSSGVNASTAKKCAVKRMSITEDGARHEIEGEIALSLSYTGCPGLMQAYEICDNEGNSFGPGQAAEAIAFFRSKPLPYVVYIIMSLAHHDLRQWSQHFRLFPQQVDVYRNPLLGVCQTHADGWIIRDISNANILVDELDPVSSVLADFGKAVNAVEHDSMFIGPRAFQAPEIDGRTKYTNKADIWTFALNVAETILPQMTTWPEWQRDAPQTPLFMARLFQQFDESARTSPLAEALVKVLRGMLIFDPEWRISALEAFETWPVIAPTNAQATVPITANPTLPSAKKAKTVTGSIQTAVVIPTSPSCRDTSVGKVEPEVPSLFQPSIPSSQGRALLDVDVNTVNAFVARKTAEVQNVKRGAEKIRVDKKAVAAKEAEDRQKAAEAIEAHRAAIADFERDTANMRKQREAIHKQEKEDAKRAKDAEEAKEAERIRKLREAREATKAEEEQKRQEAESRKLDDLFDDDGDLFEDLM